MGHKAEWAVLLGPGVWWCGVGCGPSRDVWGSSAYGVGFESLEKWKTDSSDACVDERKEVKALPETSIRE